MADVTRSEVVSISLLSAGRGDVPPLPAGTIPVGLWGISAPDGLGETDFTVRYDQSLAAAIGAGDASLSLWEYDGAWQPLPGATIKAAAHLISGTATDASFLLVAAGSDLTTSGAPEGLDVTRTQPTTDSVPEPAALPVIAAATSALLLRRRRGTPA